MVVLTADSLGKVDRSKVIAALEKIPGVVRAEVRADAGPAPVQADSSQPAIQQELPKPESKFLPRGLLVAPFHADPRCWHFFMASRHVSFGQEPGNTGSANFGEAVGLYRDAAPFKWPMGTRAPGGSFQHIQYERPIRIERPRQRRLYRRVAHQLSDRSVLRLSPPFSASTTRVRTWAMSLFSTAKLRSRESI